MIYPVSPIHIPQVLIIDDEKYNIEFLKIVLTQSGYQVESARNGAEGRRKASKLRPDLILLDIMMPGESGFETCALLKQDQSVCDIPIVFLTALDDTKNIRRGLDAGAADFIAKPFEYREVLNRIRIHLKIAFGDKFFFSGAKTPEQEAYPVPTAEKNEGICVFIGRDCEKSQNSFCEGALISDGIESLLLLETLKADSHLNREKIRKTLAANSGPHFVPSESMRNIGLSLFGPGTSKTTGDHAEAILAHIDRNNELATVVNSGGPPVIHQSGDTDFTFIEPQTAGMTATGLGLPPCSTFEFRRGDRLFLCTKSVLAGFENIAEGIVHLQNGAAASSGVDLHTACEAMGKTVSAMAGSGKGQFAIIQG